MCSQLMTTVCTYTVRNRVSDGKAYHGKRINVNRDGNKRIALIQNAKEKISIVNIVVLLRHSCPKTASGMEFQTHNVTVKNRVDSRRQNSRVLFRVRI